MAAQGEKVIVNTDLLDPQNLCPGASHDLFQRSARCHKALLAFALREIGRGQRMTINLPASVKRKRFKQDEGRGHHVVR